MTIRSDIHKLSTAYIGSRDPAILEEIEAKNVYGQLRQTRPRWQVKGNTTYFLGRGSTSDALRALAVVLRHAKGLKATIIKHQEPPPFAHLFMAGIVLTNGNHNFVIPDGFAEGYSGQGPRGLKTARLMLKNVPTVDQLVSKNEFENIFKNCNREE